MVRGAPAAARPKPRYAKKNRIRCYPKHLKKTKVLGAGLLQLMISGVNRAYVCFSDCAFFVAFT